MDVINHGGLSRAALAQHLHIEEMQLVHLALCALPRNEDDPTSGDDLYERDVRTIAAYVGIAVPTLNNFILHAMDGDYGNIGDTEHPYDDTLAQDYGQVETPPHTIRPRDQW